MPPKKSHKPKEEKVENQEPEVPISECMFKIAMELMHEGGHYMKIKYNWIQVQNDAIDFPVTDTGFLKDWNLIQIEGEEPIQQEADQQVDNKGKQAAPSKKAPPPKQGAPKGALEEITDNRPR